MIFYSTPNDKQRNKLCLLKRIGRDIKEDIFWFICKYWKEIIELFILLDILFRSSLLVYLQKFSINIRSAVLLQQRNMQLSDFLFSLEFGSNPWRMNEKRKWRWERTKWIGPWKKGPSVFKYFKKNIIIISIFSLFDSAWDNLKEGVPPWAPFATHDTLHS